MPEGERAIVLLYHRVAEAVGDPWTLAVSPINFATQMEAARAFGPVIRLGELRDAMTAGRVIDRSVCGTFDDGYADDLWHAKPILERYEVSATVFVATAAVSSVREFWWDELRRICLQTDRLRSLLSWRLPAVSSRLRWEMIPPSRRTRGNGIVAGAPGAIRIRRSGTSCIGPSMTCSIRCPPKNALPFRIVCWHGPGRSPEQPSGTDRRTLSSGELQRLFDGLVEAAP